MNRHKSSGMLSERAWYFALAALILLASGCIVFAGTALWRLGSFRTGANIAHLTLAVALSCLCVGVIAHPYLDFDSRLRRSAWRTINTISLGAIAGTCVFFAGTLAMGIAVCVDREVLRWQRTVGGLCVAVLPFLYVGVAILAIRKNRTPED